jgi:anthranilate phosphoribosyltransferase
MLDRIAGALAQLGVDRALVVSSEDGLDEMSTSGATRVVEVEGRDVRSYTIEPGACGLPISAPEAVGGGTPQENAATTRAIFAGESGPARDLALLNAGAAIYAAGRADSIAHGVEVAAGAVDEGAAQAALDRYVALSHELAPATA